MARRKEQKQLARQQRTERERAAALRGQAYKYGGIAALLIGVVASVFLVVSSIRTPSASTSVGGLPGVTAETVPWAPQYAYLAQRISNLHLPPNGNESYHVHALLHVYVNGQPVTVPANVGIDPSQGIESTMHTHDTTGIIHMEAAYQYPFKLTDFMAIWGVQFTATQLGAYQSQGDSSVQLFVNGLKVDDMTSYSLKPHDSVVLAYGAPGSFPTNPPANFSAGS